MPFLSNQNQVPELTLVEPPVGNYCSLRRPTVTASDQSKNVHSSDVFAVTVTDLSDAAPSEVIRLGQ